MLITISWSCLRDIRSKGSGTGRAPSDEPIVYMTIFYRSNSTIIYRDFLFDFSVRMTAIKKMWLHNDLINNVRRCCRWIWKPPCDLILLYCLYISTIVKDVSLWTVLYFLSFSQYYRFDNFKYKNVQCLSLTIPSTPFFWTIKFSS